MHETTHHRSGADPWRGGRPLVAVTCDVERSAPPADAPCRAQCRSTYFDAIAAAGGVPVLMPPIADLAADHARRFSAFVLTGGDDPRMEDFGRPTHPKAAPVHPRRQTYELALLDALRDRAPAKPVLGICLGMQLMALHAGGDLCQHLPEACSSAGEHWDRSHSVSPVAGASAPSWLAGGAVFSRHRQAVSDPGRLRVIAAAADGVIEAVSDPDRAWYVGVQWHPERTPEPGLGAELFRILLGFRGIDSNSNRRKPCPPQDLGPGRT